jgi:hypothetical protein
MITRIFKGCPVILCVLLLTAGIASGHGGDESLIHACLGPALPPTFGVPIPVVEGITRIVGANTRCERGETPLHWIKEFRVVLREAQQEITLAPGESASVASACRRREVVVGGGPTGIPGSLTVVFSTLFFDGRNSGWLVQFRNDGAEIVTEVPNVGATCTRGTMTSE